MKLNEIELQESEEFLTGSRIKMFFLTQIGVKITGKYEIKDDYVNVEGDVEVRSLITKKLPFRFGTVKGNFIIKDCSKLKTLEGCPSETRNFELQNLPALTSIDYCPDRVWRITFIDLKIKTLECMPKEITESGSIYIRDCSALTSLKGLPNYKSVGRIDLRSNRSLEDIRYLPKKIQALYIDNCPNLVSFEGISQYVKEISELHCSLYKIQKAGLGFLQIKLGKLALNKIWKANSGQWDILSQYLGKPDGIFDCQAALIDAGYEEFASL